MKVINKALLFTGASVLAYEGVLDAIFEKCFSTKTPIFKESFDKYEEYKDYLQNSNVNSVTITSYDGLKLNGYRINNHENNKYVIIVHGFTGSKNDMLDVAKKFDDMGYNILLIDQRASGESEGKYATYGLKESLDLIKWIDYLVNKCPDSQIVLYGVSMGASTVISSLGTKLPDNVKCAIEDSGFSSLYEELKFFMKEKYHLLFVDTILKLLEKKMIAKLDFTYEDCNHKIALKNNVVPLLIIHGTADTIVPFEMSKRIYNSTNGVKKIFVVEGTNHCEGKLNKNYYSSIKSFIDNYVM